MKTNIIVRADWDPETSVWVATSSDVPGLVLEGESIEALQSKIPGAIEDLLELNGAEDGDFADLDEIPVHIMSTALLRVSKPKH